jgi:hypothetical protein
MRTLLIIQSIIIVLGAYYIFTIAHTRDSEFDRQAEVINPVDADSKIEIQDVSEEVEFGMATDNPLLEVEGNNDIGMEFPIPDWDI